MEHTAEVGVLAQGETLAEAYSQAALGMFSFMVELDQVQERESRDVEVTAPDREALLVAWLNELLFLFDTQGLLFRRFDVQEIREDYLKARCYGEAMDPERHRVNGIKSATYHMLEVRKNRVWHVRVVLDI
jgi:SHS2 domain-containing protein